MRCRAALVLVVAVAGLAGCSSPSPRFYTLNPVAPQGTTTSKVSVAVAPISIPSSIDRPQIVVTYSANQVSFDEFNRWASPLQDNLARVVAENLAAMLGTPYVSQSSGSIYANVDYRVQIDVRNFESSPGKDAWLDAVWLVRRNKDGKSESGRTSVREPVQADGFDAIAAAHSRALARLSRDIADAVRKLEAP
jgi:uncharacterized lipoprotein YmbA